DRLRRSHPRDREREAAAHARPARSRRRRPSHDGVPLVNWGQALTDAVALGALYGVVAVGIGLVFGVMRLINFAYGELITAGAYVRWIVVVTTVSGVALLAATAALLNRTNMGLHLRAAAYDFRTARILGVRANRVIGLSFVVAGFLAAAVSVLYTVSNPLVQP